MTLSVRSRVVRGQSEALQRRLRGVLNSEKRQLKGQSPSEQEVNRTGIEMLSLLTQFEQQVVNRAYSSLGKELVPSHLGKLVLGRAAEVEEQFRAQRLKALDYSTDERLLSSIAETEVSWAYTLGSVAALAEDGVESFSIVRASECLSCCPNPEFDLANLPPFHPGCGCTVVPAAVGVSSS